MKRFLVLTLAMLMSLGCVSCNSVVLMSHGAVDNNVYKSDFTGITFTAPDGWTYLSDEEIAQLANYSAEELFDEEFADAVSEMKTFTDMMVTDPKTGTNVNILYENLGLSGNTELSLEDYLNASVEQMKTQMTGLSVKLEGSENVTLSGESYLRAQLSTSFSGVNMSQYLYMRKIGNYMVVMTVTITTGYELSDVEAMFS